VKHDVVNAETLAVAAAAQAPSPVTKVGTMIVGDVLKS
jgi:hypothetical protein